ncbi:hypothetical protein C6T53_22980 [Burkholderia multivorans]|nr:hypothetical protein C6P76_18215 [Burkholderia multivorans]PRH19490.1 hypothetical protein C6T53_22980 [Burkholderia multivorans]
MRVQLNCVGLVDGFIRLRDVGMTQSSSVSRAPLDPAAGTGSDVGFYLTFESLFPTFHFHS